MSTSPENHIVNVLSHWLARHVDNAELLRELDELDTSALTPAQAEAVQELREEPRVRTATATWRWPFAKRWKR